MHELSIAQSLIELACDTAEREGASRVTKLHLRIGAMSGVVVDSLLFSFDLAAEGTACEGAKLDIKEVAVRVHCPRCDAAKSLPDSYAFLCPTCGSPTPEILEGRELKLISLEVDEHDAACA
jgi:hydrogenase nickel incorporation protein HypA/HybF